VDLLLGSFEHACGGIGGFCAGRQDLVDVQRLFGTGYCFSASAPVYAMAWARAALALAASPEGAALRARLATARQEVLAWLKRRGIRAHGDGYLVFVPVETERAAQALRASGVEVRDGCGVLCVRAADNAEERAVLVARALGC